MTYQRPAYEEVTIAHGDHTVMLRPSLRAASTLERRYGFTDLFRRVDQFDLTTVRDIIYVASTSTAHAERLLASLSDQPLATVANVIASPVAELCRALLPEADADSQPSTGRAMPWPNVYRELYRTATGWLGWTPAEAWAATPTEINGAFSGHIAMLKAIHGSADDKPASDPDLDTDLDRKGLEALRSSIRSAGR